MGQTLAAQGQGSFAQHEAPEKTGDGFSFLAGELPPRQGRGGVPQRYSFNTNENIASTKSNS